MNWSTFVTTEAVVRSTGAGFGSQRTRRTPGGIGGIFSTGAQEVPLITDKALKARSTVV
jgi:hypothetical protein